MFEMLSSEDANFESSHEEGETVMDLSHIPKSKRRASSTTARHLHLSPASSTRDHPTLDSSAVRNSEDLGSVLTSVEDQEAKNHNPQEYHHSINGELPHSSSSANSSNINASHPCCSWEVNKMRWRIKFFFMDPVKKWRTRRQFPWKLFLQVIKIFFVTFQLVVFGNERYRFASFLKQNTVTFRHLLLEDWIDPDIPMPSVYPNTGVYCVYTRNNFYKRVDYAVNQFVHIRENAVGTYHYVEVNETVAPFLFCKREFIDAHIFPQNHSFIYDSGINETCYSINLMEFENTTFSLLTYLDWVNESLSFDRLVGAKLVFAVKSVALKPDNPDDEPACYLFDITIDFDNRGHNGQIPIKLELDPHVVPCNGRVLFTDSESVMDIVVTVLDVNILLICSVSFVLCLRALYNAELLKKAATEFFQRHYGYQLTRAELLEFLNLWYVMIVINDALIICGTMIKLKISAASITDLPLYNACGMLLGVGNLLVWLGVLRYLGFFKTYNILILTFKKAIPKVLRYLVCTLLIFCGFAFCGWIVLGPYHVKFQTFHSSTETIFSLINGDDMFATFAMLPYSSSMIFFFSRVYLYLFICIFTYVILSLMISLIMDAYGTVKDSYLEGGQSNRLQQFIEHPATMDLQRCHLHESESSFTSNHQDDFWSHCCGWIGWIRKRKLRFSRRALLVETNSASSYIPHQRLED